MLGLFSVGQLVDRLRQPGQQALRRRVREGIQGLPTGYAASGYYTADCCSTRRSARIQGKIEDKNALRAAIRAADFKSVRGDFKFGKNQFPVQNYYLQLVGKAPTAASCTRRWHGVTARGDAYVQDCKMP